MALRTRLNLQRYRKGTRRVTDPSAILKRKRRIAQRENAIRKIKQLFPRALVTKRHILQQAHGQAHRLALPPRPAGEKLNPIPLIIIMLQK